MKKNTPELIDEILKSRTFNRPADLAETYLNHKEAFPFPLRSRVKEIIEKGCKKLVSSGLINPQTLETEIKPMIDDCWKVWRADLEQMRERIDKETMKELKEKYDNKTVNEILEALLDFEPEPFLKGSPVSVVNYKKKSFLPYLKKSFKNIINATEFLLKEANLSDSEREMLQRIKTRYQDSFIGLPQVKKVTIDPVKEVLLNRAASAANGTILSGLNPSGTMDFIMQCNSPMRFFIKPIGKPKKIFLNALAIVIYRLLKEGRKKGVGVKNCQYLTSDILTQYLCLPKKLPPDFVEKILYR